MKHTDANLRKAITQTVDIFRTDDKEGMFLRGDESYGYQRTLNKSYMKPVREYILNADQDVDREDANIIFLTPSFFVAEQAAMVMEHVAAEAEQEDSEDEYNYGELMDMDREELLRSSGGNSLAGHDILIIRQEKAQKQSGAMETVIQFSRVEENKVDYRKKADTILFEYSIIMDEDEIVESMESVKNKKIYLSLPATGSYDSLIKRLMFDQNFQVITLLSPSQEDYLDYARNYMEINSYTLQDPSVLEQSLIDLKSFRGEHFTESDIYTHLERAFQRTAFRKGKMIIEKDLKITQYKKHKKASEELEDMIGLDNVKKSVKKRLGLRQLVTEHQIAMYGHMIFEGEPGVGKSVTARLYAGILAEQNVSNGRFIDVSRADLIGQFVGQTAPKIRDAFERANGGVLFVDEAAFLNGSDQYIKEAVIEFVRFMELCPQTTVIFATYPKESEELLRCDPGFASRISKVITFDTYSDEELYRIFAYMAGEKQFCLDADVKAEVMDYIKQVRTKENFGNAREMRKLLEAAMEEFGESYRRKQNLTLTSKHVRAAARQLTESQKPKKFTMGFVVPKQVAQV